MVNRRQRRARVCSKRKDTGDIKTCASEAIRLIQIQQREEQAIINMAEEIRTGQIQLPEWQINAIRRVPTMSAIGEVVKSKT